MIPKYFFLTEGVGKHKERLASFELALRNADIQQFNIVNVSSIIPSGCERIPKERGLKMIKPGEIIFAVLVKNSTNEPHRLITASVGVAIPSDRDSYGYLSEHHSFGETPQAAGDYAEELAATLTATTLEIQFDPEAGWEERKQWLKTKGLIETTNVTRSAKGDKDGLWTTVIAAAVFIP